MGSEAAGKECCRRCAACGGESAADGVQLVGEAAEPAMSELSILIFNHDYEANTQNLLFGCWGLVEGAVLVAQKLLLLTTVL